jgi:hypothetical protein
LRQLDFCEAEIAEIERVVATEALASPEIRRLMTIPGMNIITASAYMAAIGDVARFPDRKKLVGYLAANPGTKKGRRRDTGARILKSPIGGKQRGGPKPQASLFSSSSTDARPRLCHRRFAQASRP